MALLVGPVQRIWACIPRWSGSHASSTAASKTIACSLLPCDWSCAQSKLGLPGACQPVSLTFASHGMSRGSLTSQSSLPQPNNYGALWQYCAIALIGARASSLIGALLSHCWVAVLQLDGMDADGKLEEQAMLEPLDVSITVRDGGMALLTTLTPDFRWQSGSADITLRYTL